MGPVYTCRLLCVALFLAGATFYAIAKEPVAPSPPDLGKVVVNTAWTPNALYLAFRVDDPLVVGNQTLPLSQPWHDDAIAVYLDLNPRGTKTITQSCLRVVISAAGGATVQRGENGEWRDDPAWFEMSENGTIRYALKVQGTINDSKTPDEGYQVELGLAWPLLGVRPPFLQHPNDPLPAIGLAVACYSQGETCAISCWPEALIEKDLENPSTWGRMQFLQGSRPEAVRGSLASATLIPGNPFIDGDLLGAEWMTTGVFTFPKRWGETTQPIAPGRQAVSVLAAWYVLDPPAKDAVHQPLRPAGPWITPDSQLYHLTHIRDARQAGIDILAVAFPAALEQRRTARTQLAALVSALTDYEQSAAALYMYDVPSLMPVIDLSDLETLDVKSDAGQRLLEEAIDDFFAQVPVQYRTTLPNARQTFCYPVLLAHPPATMVSDEAFTGRLGARLQAKWGRPIGWLLDDAWKEYPKLPDVLTRCSWDATAGLHVGNGTMVSAVIAPGVDAPRGKFVSRRDGELYDNGWTKVNANQPDFILVRSWNDYTQGTEIAASRQFGYQYLDATKLATIRMANEHGFGMRVLRHSLPATLRAGVTYPVELLLKNSGTEKMITREGYHVGYRVTQEGRTILSGIATEQLVLLEMATARLYFTLPTAIDKRHNLPPGQYQLQLDFKRNKIPFVNVPLMTRILGTITIPFTVAKESESVQVIAASLPQEVPAGSTAPVSFQLRNTGGSAWKRGKMALRLRWVSATGEALPVEEMIPYLDKQPIDPGTIATLRGKTPATPKQAGWYRLQTELLWVADKPVPVQMANVHVTDAGARVQFLNVTLPAEVTGEQKPEAVIALRNPGPVAWSKANTRVLYQWLTWDGQPMLRAWGSAPLTEEVAVGGSTLLRIALSPPPGSGVFRCAFGLEHGDHPAQLIASPVEPVTPIGTVQVRADRFEPVDLRGIFNDWAARSATIVGKANIDGNGNAFPLEEFLPDTTAPPLGYKVGYASALWQPDAPYFRFGMTQLGKAPMVRADGQECKLPERKAKAIHLLALNTTFDNPAVFTVQYTEGEDQTAAVNISNWLDEASYHEPVMLQTRYLRTLKGDDWDLHGSLYAYTIPLDPQRTVKTLVLPKGKNICIFAITFEAVEEKQDD